MMKKKMSKKGKQMFGPDAQPMPKKPMGKMDDSAMGSPMAKKMKMMQKKFNKAKY